MQKELKSKYSSSSNNLRKTPFENEQVNVNEIKTFPLEKIIDSTKLPASDAITFNHFERDENENGAKKNGEWLNGFVKSLAV